MEGFDLPSNSLFTLDFERNTPFTDALLKKDGNGTRHASEDVLYRVSLARDGDDFLRCLRTDQPSVLFGFQDLAFGEIAQAWDVGNKAIVSGVSFFFFYFVFVKGDDRLGLDEFPVLVDNNLLDILFTILTVLE